ncbi:hypothetical protein ACTG9Q_31210 [Actinokineospora sp. 24-640]
MTATHQGTFTSAFQRALWYSCAALVLVFLLLLRLPSGKASQRRAPG